MKRLIDNVHLYICMYFMMVIEYFCTICIFVFFTCMLISYNGMFRTQLFFLFKSSAQFYYLQHLF